MLWIEAVKRLTEGLDEPFALEFTYRNLHELTKLGWLNLMREEIVEEELTALTDLSARLKKNEPPQYIVGWSEFCGLRFAVDARVLIPRPETEELVQMILAENDESPLSVLDIGTGSGAIAISLAAARPNWRVTASDLSAEALAVAAENAVNNKVKIDFIQSDVLDDVAGKFDIIVSNPPYIAFDETYEVDTSVDTYEPHSALYAENQGLALYQKIAEQAPSALSERGKIYLEIGYKQGQSVSKIFQEKFTNKTVSVHKDVFEKDRMVSVR